MTPFWHDFIRHAISIVLAWMTCEYVMATIELYLPVRAGLAAQQRARGMVAVTHAQLRDMMRDDFVAFHHEDTRHVPGTAVH